MVAFYEKAIADPVIGYLFTDVAHLDLKKHLPVIGDFWETLLLGTKVYQRHNRNPLMIHAELHEKSALKAKHFRRWLEIFRETVGENFCGERADFAVMRAEAIANRFLNFVSGIPAVARS